VKIKARRALSDRFGRELWSVRQWWIDIPPAGTTTSSTGCPTARWAALSVKFVAAAPGEP
jgi:hypothetical protein